jgi:two-component system, cell cycle response regulator
MPARILVIEDNPDNLDLMVYLLQAFGHTTITLVDGGRALDVAREHRPDLIICDIQLPTVDGIQVANRLKSESSLSAIPVLAVTAYAMVGDRNRLLAAGFDGYISKPIDPEKFVDHIHEFLPVQHRSSRPATSATTKLAVSSSLKLGTVLVVDDLAENLQLMTSLLEPLGYVVHSCFAAEEAFLLARQKRPDLIISDVHLARQGGYGLIRRVKSDPDLHLIPCALISSSTLGPVSDEEARAAGAEMFILRPIEPEHLLAKIQSMIQKGSTAARRSELDCGQNSHCRR